MILLVIGGAVYGAGRLVFSLEGRYWAARHVWRGNPTRLKPVIEEALAKTARTLDLPAPPPQLFFYEADSTGTRRFESEIRLAPGVSPIEANAGFTRGLTDLGLALDSGTELTDRSVMLRFWAGDRARVALHLLPATGTGLDTTIVPAPDHPPVQVKARMAIIIDNYGSRPELTRRFDDLPGVFTAAVYPELDDARAWADRARDRGMEVLVNLPMEPKAFPVKNPGPNAVLVDLSGRAIRKLVRRAVDRVGPVIGIKTYMGSLAVEDRDVMRSLLEEVKELNLVFVDATAEKYSTSIELGREIDLPVIALDSVADVERGHGNAATVGIRFDDFVDVCRKRGYGVGVVVPQEGTLEVLESRLDALARQGIVVMGLGEVLRVEDLTAYP